MNRRLPFRVEPCACGSLIYVYTPEISEVMDAVRRHNMSGRHREWRALGGLSMEPDPELLGRVAA